MRKLLLLAAIAVAMPVAANATTWVAICNDGQHLQYNQTVGGPGFLYLHDNPAMNGGIQIARLTQSFYNGIAICGAVIGNGTGAGGVPLTQLCANKDRKIIYIKWQSPQAGVPMKDFTFCQANVRVQ